MFRISNLPVLLLRLRPPLFDLVQHALHRHPRIVLDGLEQPIGVRIARNRHFAGEAIAVVIGAPSFQRVLRGAERPQSQFRQPEFFIANCP